MGKPGLSDLPDLDSFLNASRRPQGPCMFVRVTTPEQRAAIRARVDQGIHKWAAYERWLTAQEVELTSSKMIELHFRNHRSDDE